MPRVLQSLVSIDELSEMPPDARDDNADGASLMERVYVRSSLRPISYLTHPPAMHSRGFFSRMASYAASGKGIMSNP
jgi:hypothetical protein